MVTSIVASSGSAVATFRSLGRGDVALYLQERLLDLTTWQPLGNEVPAFLISLHRLIGATFLGQDAALNPIPQGVVEWPRAAWRELPRANLRLSSTYIDFRSGCLRPWETNLQTPAVQKYCTRTRKLNFRSPWTGENSGKQFRSGRQAETSPY